MGKAVGYQNAFTGGEIGPDAWERSDLQQHARGCAEAKNLLALVTGPLASRGGFWDRGATAFQATASRIVGFARSADDALFVELGDLTARVWTTDGNPVMDGDDPFAFETPWTAAQVFRLWFKQIGDVLYVTDLDGGPTQVIKRMGDTAWSVTAFAFREGPWLSENTNEAAAITASALTGLITITSAFPIFVAEDVGSLLRIREGDGNPGWQTWTSQTNYDANQIVQFDGRVYQRSASGEDSSGTTPPLHSSGVMSDGAVDWTFLHDGAGIVRILTFVDASEITGQVVRRIPTISPTRYWAKQAYSAVEGFPRALAEEREERLAFAGSLKRPGIVDMTRTAGFGPDFGDFKPGLGTGRVVADDAVRLDVGGGSRVVWLLAGTALIAGCTDGEYIVSGATLDDPITPDGRTARRISTFGNADVEPLMVQGPPPVILHVLRSRKVLRETRVSGDQSVESHELSVLPHHIFDRGVAELAWQQPDNIVWMRLDDGGLAALTYHLEHQVVAATDMPLPGGFKVESIASTPSPGGGDVIMATVMREKDGEPQRRVWKLSARSEGLFLDGAQEYAGEPTTTVGGLDLYDGEVVGVVAGLTRIRDKTVEAGEIALPEPEPSVRVGLKMQRRFMTLPLDMEGAGSTAARKVAASHATVIVSGVEVRVGMDGAGEFETVRARAASELTGPVGKRMRAKVSLGGGVDRDRRLVIESDVPFDLMIHAYRLDAEVTS